MKKKQVWVRGKTEHLVKQVNMKKWRKNKKMKMKNEEKNRFENDEEAFFLSKEIYIVQNNLEIYGANIATWIFDKEKLIS